MRKILIGTGWLIFSLFLTGCELPGSPALSPTLTILEVYGTAGITPGPSPTPPPPTPTPTIVPVLQLHNGFNQIYLYPEIGMTEKGSILRDDPFEVTGRNEPGDWLQIRYQKDKSAWIPVAEMDLIGNVDLTAYPVVDPYPQDSPIFQDWKGGSIKTLCLKENTTYIGTYISEHPDEIPDAVFSPQVLGILHAAGIMTSIVGEPCDATLSVSTTIEPRGKQFVEAVTNIKRYCYSGVNIDSNWLLQQGDTKLTFNLKKSRGTVDKPLYCVKTSTHQKELDSVVHSALHRLLGTAALHPMLLVDNPTMNDNAIQLAGADGRKSMAVVPDLIGYLDHPDHQRKAWSALKTITGKGFSENKSEWRNWWQTTVESTTASTN